MLVRRRFIEIFLGDSHTDASLRQGKLGIVEKRKNFVLENLNLCEDALCLGVRISFLLASLGRNFLVIGCLGLKGHLSEWVRHLPVLGVRAVGDPSTRSVASGSRQLQGRGTSTQSPRSHRRLRS